MSIKNISLSVAVYLNTSISLGEVVYIYVAKNIYKKYRDIVYIAIFLSYRIGKEIFTITHHYPKRCLLRETILSIIAAQVNR